MDLKMDFEMDSMMDLLEIPNDICLGLWMFTNIGCESCALSERKFIHSIHTFQFECNSEMEHDSNSWKYITFPKKTDYTAYYRLKLCNSCTNRKYCEWISSNVSIQFTVKPWTMSVSNQEEKTDNNDDGLEDLGIPVPVQTFLWGQIAPFIRPKLGKLHEAACMVSIFSIFFLQLHSHFSICLI